MKKAIFALGIIAIITFALLVGTTLADILVADWVEPSSDIIAITVEKHGSALISIVECKIDFVCYDMDGQFDVYYLLPKNAENITVRCNQKEFLHDSATLLPECTYYFVRNASEYINTNVKVPSEYINDYNVISWTVRDEDWQPSSHKEKDYMPTDINVTYTHILEESNQTYTLKYSLIPLDYTEIDVRIKLPENTNPDSIMYKPKQLQLSTNDTGAYLHLKENNSDYHVPFGDLEICFSTHTNATIPVPDSSIYEPKSPIYVPDDFSTIQDAVDAAYLGDTIIVRDGIYTEDVSVYKRVTIRSENGFDSTIVQNFDVAADYVTINGFSMEDYIVLYSSDYCNISNLYCFRRSIILRHSSNNILSNNICSSHQNSGIQLYSSSNNSICNNTCSNNYCYGGTPSGICLSDSNNNLISNNNCSSNDNEGILLDGSNNNSVCNNFCSNNDDGISLRHSSNNTISNNTFINDGLLVQFSYHNTVEGNTVNNKPLIYLEDASDYKIEDAGQVILINCRNITAENLDLSNTCVGIELWETENSIIAANTVSDNHYGIYLRHSSNNTITGNTASNNGYVSIRLMGSRNNTLTGNNVYNNYRSIDLYDSCNNTITGNNVYNNDIGISLYDSSNNNIITGNTLVNDGLYVSDVYVSFSYQNIVEDNTVNGKPLVYLVDVSNYKVEDAGQVILVNCNNITVENLDLSNTDVGVKLWKTEKCIITNNNVGNNGYGIQLTGSRNNTLTGNNVYNNYRSIDLSDSCNNTITGNNACNNRYGISLYDSSNNNIYLNNFINNNNNVKYYYKSTTNIWNSPLEITYTYDGTTYTNYLGNYWDDYEGTDADRDGIGDTDYSIYSKSDESDDYPLMDPFENYNISTSALA